MRQNEQSTTRALKNCLNVYDVKKAAYKVLPLPIREYIDSGADDEITLKENTRAFKNYTLIPSFGNGLETSDMSMTILGQPSSWPLMLSPWGVHKLMHKGGEKATARAAEKNDTVYMMSNFSTTSMEEVSEAVDGVKFFQLQPARERSIMSNMMTRAKESGYKALIVTIDNPILGNREGEARTGFGVPPKLNTRSIFSMMAHPKWVLNYVLNPPTFANFLEYFEEGKDYEWLFHNLVCPVTWDDLKWIRSQWEGPLAIKGILSADSARKVVEIGAEGVIVSNQGARNFDAIPSSLSMLGEVLEAVDGDAEVIFDSGIRRGTDVLKALAMGAKACMTARPFVYGLSAAGEEGVSFVINMLKVELERAMIVSGAKTISDINASMIRKL